jgi:NAD(P)-dependent dehydrogenase (short-subunit alcohol dehydrogenase family)
MNEMFSLRGKTVLVTGANRGIGLGLARAVGAAGARVVIWGRAEDRNQAAVQALQNDGIEVLAQAVDVADEAQVRAAFAAAVAHVGDIHGVVANAGVSSAAIPFHEVTTAEYMRVINTNQFGVMYTLRAAVEHMVERARAGKPGGSLVGVASTAAIQGYALRSPYAASKGALLSLTRTLAVEYGKLGIRANAIILGVIDTDLIPEERKAGIAALVAQRAAIPRLGRTEDVSALVTYLLADGSSFHTGDCLTLDGGFSIRGLG